MSEARIDRAHYDFARYVDIRRWCSYWHQAQETLALQPDSVLEIGVGNGLYRALLRQLGCGVTSVDVNASLQPDHVGSVTALPFADGSYACVVAFQVLEHLPYEDFRTAVSEMRRVARGHVLLSLPDAGKVWRGSLDLGRREHRWMVDKPLSKSRRHRVTGDHQWEIGKRGYPAKRIVEDLGACGLEVLRNYRAAENPYHRFLVCRKLPPA